MFMTEMLHQAHSRSHAAGVFRTGSGESAMQPFMDQALGDAVASRGGTGLAQSIERLLNSQAAAKGGK
jgi:Rod binding domain-containing protein